MHDYDALARATGDQYERDIERLHRETEALQAAARPARPRRQRRVAGHLRRGLSAIRAVLTLSTAH
jgi:hypothetical protein